MIKPRKLIDYVTAEPFRPFRINMASGQIFVVRHPEYISISRSLAKIFTLQDESEAEEKWHDVSLMLMESVESLDTSLTQDQS